jgi:hypothetical protein
MFVPHVNLRAQCNQGMNLYLHFGPEHGHVSYLEDESSDSLGGVHGTVKGVVNMLQPHTWHTGSMFCVVCAANQG